MSRRLLRTYAVPPLDPVSFQPGACDFATLAAYVIAGARYRIVETGWSVSDAPANGGDRHGLYRIGAGGLFSEDLLVPTDLPCRRNTLLPDGWSGIVQFAAPLTLPWGVSSIAHQPLIWVDVEELSLDDPALAVAMAMRTSAPSSLAAGGLGCAA